MPRRNGTLFVIQNCDHNTEIGNIYTLIQKSDDITVIYT